MPRVTNVTPVAPKMSVSRSALKLTKAARSRGACLRYRDARAAVMAAIAIRHRGFALSNNIESVTALDPPLRLAARTVLRVLALVKGTDFSPLLSELDRLDALDVRIPRRQTTASEFGGPWRRPRPRGVFTLSEWRQKAGRS